MEKRLSPVEPQGGLSFLFRLSEPSVRLRSQLVWLAPYSFRTHGGLRSKSTVCGLNGHRLYYIISLFKVTYKSTIQVSRTFYKDLKRIPILAIDGEREISGVRLKTVPVGVGLGKMPAWLTLPYRPLRSINFVSFSAA